MAIKFTDNSGNIKTEVQNAILAGLEELTAELESQTKKNTGVNTGGLKAGWTHTVDKSNMEGIVGHPEELAIWYELGTGIHALNGDGRKDVPWKYQDDAGFWHWTDGMDPHRPLETAKNTVEPKIQKVFESKLKGLK